MGETRTSRVSAANADTPTRLNSWKEIAAYLDRDPRTVQLWERHEGLPIHRLTHNVRSSVYAFSAEIDTWMQAHSGHKTDSPHRESAPPPATVPVRRFRFKGFYLVAIPVLAGLLAESFWISDRGNRSPTPAPAALLAVLPFQNQTSSDDLLSDGLTDGVIRDLGRLGSLQVLSWSSVMQFKGQHVPLQQIAHELHATLVLEGSVAEVDGKTQVTVDLLDTAGNKHLWGATYRHTGSSPLVWQDEIASQIALAVTRRLSGATHHVVFNPATVDPKAQKAYLTGRFYWNQRNLPDLQKAISFFGQAIALDPKCVPAYTGLAESYDLMTDRGILSDAEAFQRAEAAATTALALDPSSAEAYNALAFATYRQDWNFARGEEYFQKALALNPDYAVAHQWYGEMLGDLGRFDQSIAELRKAKELDPLSPMARADLADGYIHAGRLAEADSEIKRILDLYPKFAPAHLYRITLYIQMEDLAAAENEARIYQQSTGDSAPLRMIKIRRLSASGHLDEARAALRRLLSSPRGTVFNAYQKAGLYFVTQQNALGYTALEEAYRERSWWLVNLLIDPSFQSVRSHARFIAMVRRVGLPLPAPASPLEGHVQTANWWPPFPH